MSVKPIRANASLIWQFFYNKDSVNKVATCSFCQRTLSFNTTSGHLKYHLKRQHPEAYKEVCQQEKLRAENLHSPEELSQDAEETEFIIIDSNSSPRDRQSESLYTERKPVKKRLKRSTSQLTLELDKRKREQRECDTYGNLISQKLLNFEDCDRLVLMNKIDNLIFNTAMEVRLRGGQQSRDESPAPESETEDVEYHFEDFDDETSDT